MSPRRPLVLTTRSHPVALATYAGQLLLGVLYLTGVAQARALTGLTESPGFSTLWAVGLTTGAAVALTGSTTPRGRLAWALLAEAVGAGALAITQATYAASLLVDASLPDALSPGPPAPTPWATVVFAAALAVGCVIRAAQCLAETRRALAAVAVGRPADPPPLAEAPEKGR